MGSMYPENMDPFSRLYSILFSFFFFSLSSHMVVTNFDPGLEKERKSIATSQSPFFFFSFL